MFLCILEKPRIKPESEQSEYSVLVGDPLTIGVSITGHPPPRVSWTFNSEDLSKEEDIEILIAEDKHIMTINKTKVKQAGTYIITAVNDGGTSKIELKLNVLGK